MKEIRAYKCGLYRPFGCNIKRKYTEDRSPVALPKRFTVLIVPDGMTDELRENLSTAGYQVAVEDIH